MIHRRFLGLHAYSWLVIAAASAILASIHLIIQRRFPIDPRAEEPVNDPFWKMRNQVGAEIEEQKKPHPWAGFYSNSGGRMMSPTTIYLAPSGRACVATFYDFGPSIAGPCGTLRLEGGRFVAVDWPKAPLEFGGGAPPFLFARWGRRSYLVPEERILDFVNDVNSGAEPRYATDAGCMFGYMRDYQRARELLVTGHPQLPRPYDSMLRPEPIEARLSAPAFLKREAAHWTATAVFDKGARQGIWRGMELFGPMRLPYSKAIIEEVGPGWARAALRVHGAIAGDLLPTNTLFSTVAPWNAGLALSTEPLHIKATHAASKRFPPFFGVSVQDLFREKYLKGSVKAGFSCEKVGEVVFRGAFRGALSLAASKARMDRAVASLGANMFISVSEEDAGELRKFVLYRLSFRGKAIDPDSGFSPAGWPFRAVLGKKRPGSLFDWDSSVVAARAALCGAGVRRRAAEREAGMRLLSWNDETLAKAALLRFSDLNKSQRLAAEALVPPERRTGYVWPALIDEESELYSKVWEAGRRAEDDFKKRHPAAASECERLESEAQAIKRER